MVQSLSAHRAPCGEMVRFGAVKGRVGKLKAGSTVRAQVPMPVATPSGPSGANSISRVDLPLARRPGLCRRVQRLFPLLLPQIEDPTPRRSRPHARRSRLKRRNSARRDRATRVPGRRRVGTTRQSWRKRGIQFYESVDRSKVRSRAEKRWRSAQRQRTRSPA